MERPDFTIINDLIHKLRSEDAEFERLFSEAEAEEEEIRKLCGKKLRKQAESALEQIPVDELRNTRAGIRTAILEKAGYQSLLDLYRTNEWKLQQIEGIGEKQTASIRNTLEEFLRMLSTHERIHLDEDSEEGQALITALARYRQKELIRKDAGPLHEQIQGFIADRTDAVKIRSRLHWVFSLRETKESSMLAVGSLLAFCRSPEYKRMQNFLRLYEQACRMDADDAEEDYNRNSADYYAILEKLTGASLPQEVIYSSVPAELAAQIDAFELDLSLFRGNLRSYQAFGTRYILTQKRVLLGDEMGLGKTIQAIAAMAHLTAAEPGAYFLVVCPASVMVNWCREISKFSSMEPCLLHGSGLETALSEWEIDGGIAVTNYESMGKIVPRVNNRMRLAMLVIDEAHYIKNPEAQRTKYIHALEDESERILMMTGTPLENRVSEMCQLLGFVRPDMDTEIRTKVGMRHVPAFRELLAPVYLRRRRDQVLEELPPITEEEEWCSMTSQDNLAYGIQALAENFPGMRRVSFLQEDMTTSSKGIRLKELCEAAADEGRKIIVYSYFRETIRKVEFLLRFGDDRILVAGVITGSTPVEERQAIIDRFTQAPVGSILVCQVQSGGTGLNIQAANVVIFCEPQIKPSLTNQAISRVFRMGQVRNVLVYHLLCENTVDEAVRTILVEKQEEFDLYADVSTMGDAADALEDREWIRRVIEEEHRKYLPAVVN